MAEKMTIGIAAQEPNTFCILQLFCCAGTRRKDILGPAPRDTKFYTVLVYSSRFEAHVR